MLGGSWQEPRRLLLTEGAGNRWITVCVMVASLGPGRTPNSEHLSILIRWHSSTWRDGEWIGFDSLERIPYRKLVNAIGRVHRR